MFHERNTRRMCAAVVSIRKRTESGQFLIKEKLNEEFKLLKTAFHTFITYY